MRRASLWVGIGLVVSAVAACGDATAPAASGSPSPSDLRADTQTSTPAPSPTETQPWDLSVYVDRYVTTADGNVKVTFTGSPCTDHRVDVVDQDAASVTLVALLVIRTPPEDCGGDIGQTVEMEVALDEPLGDRLVIDRKTGQPAGPGEGWWRPVVLQDVTRVDGRLVLTVEDPGDADVACTGLFRAMVGQDTPPTAELVTLVAESWQVPRGDRAPSTCSGRPSVPDPVPPAPVALDLMTGEETVISAG